MTIPPEVKAAAKCLKRAATYEEHQAAAAVLDAFRYESPQTLTTALLADLILAAEEPRLATDRASYREVAFAAYQAGLATADNRGFRVKENHKDDFDVLIDNYAKPTAVEGESSHYRTFEDIAAALGADPANHPRNIVHIAKERMADRDALRKRAEEAEKDRDAIRAKADATDGLLIEVIAVTRKVVGDVSPMGPQTMDEIIRRARAAVPQAARSGVMQDDDYPLDPFRRMEGAPPPSALEAVAELKAVEWADYTPNGSRAEFNTSPDSSLRVEAWDDGSWGIISHSKMDGSTVVAKGPSNAHRDRTPNQTRALAKAAAEAALLAFLTAPLTLTVRTKDTPDA